ncbi:hypothetical protein [Microbulbifer sp. THAF38]|uniref:hypothetical protein n=1 Tax=Microbulbifer sp. THAF38 TaxID=2587856 RepID=UPI0012A882C4|nr:hypothetical protein [Microbulbifer sp. THAF38]QFT54424.1 hypothetical protein FIU95_07630 [Microbulbifer sp. THAF38]
MPYTSFTAVRRWIHCHFSGVSNAQTPSHLGIFLAEVYKAENLHHFAQVPFPPLVARLNAQLLHEFRRHIHRVIERTYQFWRKVRR